MEQSKKVQNLQDSEVKSLKRDSLQETMAQESNEIESAKSKLGQLEQEEEQQLKKKDMQKELERADDDLKKAKKQVLAAERSE